jgi:hypothetical protein
MYIRLASPAGIRLVEAATAGFGGVLHTGHRVLMPAVVPPGMRGPPEGFTHDLLAEIDATTQEVFDLATLADAKRREGSRRNSYEKALEEVKTRAGKPGARALAEWIQSEIRDTEEFPSGRAVRKRGARLCRENGHEVSAGSWLGA